MVLKVLSPDVLTQKPKLLALRDYLTSWHGRADIISLGLPMSFLAGEPQHKLVLKPE
jgi:penicillin amidase